MSKFHLLKGYSRFYYRQNSSGSYRCHWMHPGKVREFDACKTFEEVLLRAKHEFPEEGHVGDASPEAALPPLPPLDAALTLYPPKMRYRGKLAGERRQKEAVAAIRRILAFHKHWKNFSDITEEGLEAYLDHRRKESSHSAFKEVLAFVSFLFRHTREGYIPPSWLSSFENRRPESHTKHSAWSAEEWLKWMAYLTRDMEVLAKADSSWSWQQRVAACCHTAEFSERMLLLPLQLLQARGLYRPGESRKVSVRDWNGITRILKPSPQAMKCKIKVTLVDDETAWLYDVCALGRSGEETLAEFDYGKGWKESTLTKTMRWHLDSAGMEHRLPYDVKYTMATFIYDNPELFQDEGHEKRLDRVRAIIGHEKNSLITERYIQSRWGSAYGSQIQSYFNTQKIFPFDVNKFPVREGASPSSPELTSQE